MNIFTSHKKVRNSRFFGKKQKTKNKGRGREFIGKLSKGLMLPIAMLPVAGLFLGIGAFIATEAGNAGFFALEDFGIFLRQAGDVIFGALPVLFAIAIAIAFTGDAGAAGLSALVGYLVFGGLQAALLQKNGDGFDLLFYVNGSLGEVSNGYGLPSSLVGTVLGIQQLQTSVFGGFIVGFTVAFLYNKFKKIQLPAVIGFFNGVRFIPIVTFAALFPITLIVLMLWPLVGIAFSYIGGALGSNSLGFNSFIFGYIERALVPFGLHHAFYSPLWYSDVGGLLDLSDLAILNGSFVSVGGVNQTWSDLVLQFGGNVSSNTIAGDQGIWAFVNSYLAGRHVMVGGETHIITFSDFTTSIYQEHLSQLNGRLAQSKGINIGQYMQGKYQFMIFGLPAAALAMVMAAPKENRKASASIVVSAGFTSLLTGITEPIEFTFLFLAPWLFWGFHAFMCALSFGLMNWIGLIFPDLAPHIGQTFSGGILDWIVYGGVQINGGSNAWWTFVFGAAYAPIYFFFFYWAIRRFNIGTPGRGDNMKLFTKADFISKSQGNENILKLNINPLAVEIVKAYGGLENIKNVDACITKLRIDVNDQSKVDENRLKNELGAMGTIRPGPNSVYSIYGGKADFYKEEIKTIIEEIEKDNTLKDRLFNDNVKVEAVDNPIKKIENKYNKKIFVYAPCDGNIVGIDKVPDQTFSEKMIGDGVAIIPSSNQLFSVINNGVISSAFPTGHAYTFRTQDESEIMLHIGIDSINLKNDKEETIKAFKTLIKVDEKINKNTPIVNISLNALNYAKSKISPIIILNETLNNRKIQIVAKGNVKKGDLLFTVE